MSLLDALLLDPAPFHVWVADRLDKQRGSGTASDPYHGGLNRALVSQFDTIMNLSPLTLSNVVVHLGPGTYVTKGFTDGVAGGWQVRSRMKILGSGIDVTVLQVDNSAATAGKHVFAIAHSLAAGVLVDAAEIADLTVDCNCGGTSAAAFGAIRILGNNARVRRVKIRRWGTLSTSVPAFGIVCLTGNPTAGNYGVDNIGMEDCYAMEPAIGVTNSIATAFSIGDWSYSAPASSVREPEGKSPFIRNCYVDGSNPGVAFTPSTLIPSGAITGTRSASALVAVSMCWCRGGVVEGNQIYNVDVGGPYQEWRSVRDAIIRNNFMKNVAKGVYLNLGQIDPTNLLPGFSPVVPLGWSGRTGSIGLVGTVLDLSALQDGDRVTIAAANALFTGSYVVHDVVKTGTNPSFQIDTPVSFPLGTTLSSVNRVYAIGRAIIEGNIIELATGAVAGIGVHIGDTISGSAGIGSGPDYLHGEVICRGNKIRYVDGASPLPSNAGYAIQVNGAKNLQVMNSLVDVYRPSFPATPQPVQNLRCGTATYFNNRTSGGALVQGVNAAAPPRRYDELDILADDAFVLAFAES